MPDDSRAEAAIVYALDRQVRTESEASHCELVEALVAEGLPHAPALLPQKWDGQRLAAVCWANRSRVAFAASNWDTASLELNRAKRFQPEDPLIKQSLARVEVNRGIDLSNLGECDEARPHLVAAVRGEPALQQKVTESLGNCGGAAGGEVRGRG